MNISNKILFDKIKVQFRNYMSDSQLLDFSTELELAKPPEFAEKDAADSGNVSLRDIETRNIIDKTISFAEKHLQEEDYKNFLLELAIGLSECDEINVAEEILTNLINDSNKDRLQAEALLALADIFIRKTFWDKSIVLIVKAREMFGDLNDKVGLAKCENLAGTYYGERGEIVSARNHFINSLNLLDENRDDNLSAKIESNLAILEIIRGNYEVANKYFNSAIGKFEKVGEYKRIAIQRHNLGMMYFHQKEYNKAIKEFDSVIEISSNKQYQTLLTISYLGKANALALLKDNKQALEFCYKAMDIAIKIEDRLTIADVYRVIGIIERNYKHFDLAEKYLDISLRLNDELKNRLNTAETSYEFGVLYNESGNATAKSDWLQKALKYYQEIKAIPIVTEINGLLSAS